MSSPTYTCTGIVLRKTKLGEADLILSILKEDGSLLKCVAKGARKPTSSFSSRLELFSEVDILCARGRSLDIVKEARLIRGNDSIRSSIEHASAASPMAELLSKLAQEGLENRLLFQSSSVAFEALSRVDASMAPAVCAAHLLKTLAYAGLRPSFDVCVSCGCALAGQLADAAFSSFSFSEGGVVCAECRSHCDCVSHPNQALSWSRYLLGVRFSDLLATAVPLEASFAALRLAQGLIRAHVGANLKSLEFMLSCGLYG